MAVKKPLTPATPSALGSSGIPDEAGQEARDTEGGVQVVDFSNGKIMTAIGIAIWLVVLAANVYVIVTLAIGKEG